MSLNTSLSPDLFRAPAAFWRWWTAELSDLWHRLPLSRGTRGPKSYVYVEPARVLVERVVDQEVERFIEELPFDGLGDEGFGELRALTAETAPTLLLTAPDIHTTKISFPRSVRSRLASAIELQMTLVAPLKPELVVWAIIDIVDLKDSLQVEVAMAKKARLEELRDRLAENGCSQWPIAVSGPRGAIAFPGFGPQTNVGFSLSEQRWLIAALLALSTIPLTLLAGSSVLTARAENRVFAMRDQVHDIRVAQKSATQMQERRRLLAPLFSQPGAAAILNEISRQLPKTDWLRSAERRSDGSVRLIIASKDPDTLDKSLRRSRLLATLHVTEESPSAEGWTDITYETDAV